MASPLKHAIASLLRLAEAGLQDAWLLLEHGSLRNAAAVQRSALDHAVDAVAASEQGWPAPASGLAGIPGDNPIRARLAALMADAPALLADGRLPSAPDERSLRRTLDQFAPILAKLATHFVVDLDGEDGAGAVAPMRPEPAPKAPDPPDLHLVAPAPVIQPPEHAATLSSTLFWSLADRWGLPDLDALPLLGHAGGLTKAGTRPRFKLAGAEAERLAQLRQIDDALAALGLDPRAWLRQAIQAAPFAGATPLAVIARDPAQGIRTVSRHILQQGLRLSMRQP